MHPRGGAGGGIEREKEEGRREGVKRGRGKEGGFNRLFESK